jgi:hypothetical protein
MATGLSEISTAAADFRGLAHWWAEALGWQVRAESDGEAEVAPPDGEPGIALVFSPVGDPKTGKNRLHLDVASHTPDEQQALVDTLERLGATRVDVGQADVPWVVLADPEGNEFCVLEYRDRYAEHGSLASVVIDAADPGRLARFWSEAAGWPLLDEGPHGATLRDPTGRSPDLDFVLVPDVRAGRNETGKNRLHLDVRPAPGGDRDEEVRRLLALGATPLDVGQRDVDWVVLADVEGNAFCVLSRPSA